MNKLSTGLGKLVEARHQVEAMNEELEAKKEDVAKKQRECDELMVVIVEKRTLADEQMKQVSRYFSAFAECLIHQVILNESRTKYGAP